MNGHTRCPFCLRVVKVTNGKLNRHVSGFWKPTCQGFKTDAKWVEQRSLIAHGRNPDGYCMRCKTHIDDGPNCTQCGLE